MPKGRPGVPKNYRTGPKPSLTKDEDRKVSRMYQSGLSQAKISALLGKGQRAIVKSLRRTKTRMRGRANHGESNGAWKGGRTMDKGGYVLVRQPDHPHATSHGYVREHRVVAEMILGRLLLPGEVVHHKNRVRDDNRPENLEVFSNNGDHLRHELTGRCPRWTEGGYRRMLAAARRKKLRAEKRRRQRESDAPR